MMPPEDGARKRKACQACIRAKAKCSPSTDRNDLCFRCQRLGKECFYEDSVRKRGPKSRSRVKQLEQRVDSLIGLLAANGQTFDINERPKVVYEGPSTAVTIAENDGQPPASDASVYASHQISTPTETPEDQRANSAMTDEFEAYDPVQAGDISETDANTLLNEFKEAFVYMLPFVVVPSSVDANTLRKSQPFLFLAIMTVASYRKPLIQRTLSTKLKSQMATRIIERSHKSLEILQGLLVYGGWYHFFYRPSNQQLAILIQLCVAMVQDLGLSKNPNKGRKVRSLDDPFATNVTERTSAGERAFLGTYYLSSGFAQAWRKRSTIQHTRYMAQCAERITRRLEYPSDAIVSPLIQLSELMCRINNFFSYDDIENADVKGDLMLEMSTANFCSELDRLRDTVPLSVKNHPTFDANFRLLGIWIHECGVHTPLWASPHVQLKPSISPTRLRILYRCVNATKSYVNAVLSIPHSSLHHLASPPWAAWFYAIVVACKLVFLEENERASQTDIEPTDCEVVRLMNKPDFDKNAPHVSLTLPTEAVPTTSWDPVSVAKEADLQNMFDRFIMKMEFAVPTSSAAMEINDFDPLFCMTCLQLSLSQGYAKRMREHLAKANASPSDTVPNTATPYAAQKPDLQAAPLPQFDQTPLQTRDFASTEARNMRTPPRDHPIPIMSTFNFNSLNFDSIAWPDLEQAVQPAYDGWIWDIAMDDFSMPPL